MKNKHKEAGRKQGRQSAKRNVLIVCEGKTEQLYFNALRSTLKLQTTDIKIEPEVGSHNQVIERAVSLREGRRNEARKSSVLLEYDEVWCVFDSEDPNQHIGALEKAVSAAKRNGLLIAVSTPSFEIWYLWHFTDTSKYFENGQVVKQALRHYIQGYTETTDVFQIICPHTSLAMQRAARRIEDAENEFQNPSTYIYKLLCKAFFTNQSLVGIRSEEKDKCLYGIGANRCRFCYEQVT